MSNTFTTKRARGFTLIELLVVIAIIGLLSTIIAAPIQNARKKARDAKKIAELKAMQLALEQYAESNSGAYPINLSALSPAYMPVLPTFAASTTSSARDAFPYAVYVGRTVGALDQIFAYHLGAKLEVYGPALETDRDCWGAYVGTSLNVPACVVFNGSDIQIQRSNNGSQVPASVTTGAPTVGVNYQYIGLNVTGTTTVGTGGVSGDFSGLSSATTTGPTPAEDPLGSCVSIDYCMFDVTSQQ